MIELEYNEEWSNELIESDMTDGLGASNGVTADNMIVLIMKFHTGVIGISPGLNPNFTYTGYDCTLIRDNKDSEWKIDFFSI